MAHFALVTAFGRSVTCMVLGTLEALPLVPGTELLPRVLGLFQLYLVFETDGQ